jgi:CHASE3 domain sensor protein
VLVEANHLERLVIDLETGQRGFILTGEERFLQPWRDARAALPKEISTLEQVGGRQSRSGGAGAGRDPSR